MAPSSRAKERAMLPRLPPLKATEATTTAQSGSPTRRRKDSRSVRSHPLTLRGLAEAHIALRHSRLSAELAMARLRLNSKSDRHDGHRSITTIAFSNAPISHGVQPSAVNEGGSRSSREKPLDQRLTSLHKWLDSYHEHVHSYKRGPAAINAFRAKGKMTFASACKLLRKHQQQGLEGSTASNGSKSVHLEAANRNIRAVPVSSPRRALRTSELERFRTALANAQRKNNLRHYGAPSTRSTMFGADTSHHRSHHRDGPSVGQLTGRR